MVFGLGSTFSLLYAGGGGSQKKVQVVFVAIVHEVTVTHYTFLVNYQNPDSFLVLLFLGAVRGYYNGVGIDFLVMATPAKSTTNFSKNITKKAYFLFCKYPKKIRINIVF